MSGLYVGGPLDGQPASPVRGRWSTWRDEDGEPVPLADGDRRFLGHDRHSGPPFYIDLFGDGVYLHADELRRRARLARGAGAPT